METASFIYKKERESPYLSIYRRAAILAIRPWIMARSLPTRRALRLVRRYTEMTVVSLMCCKVKLDRMSTTAGCCISLSMAKRENSVRSFTCTRSK